MTVIGTDLVETYCKSRTGHRGIKAARAQYDARLGIVENAAWQTPTELKQAHPKASILRGGRVIFHKKSADEFRLIALVQREDGILIVRF